jgi:hypothetical protein
VCCAVLCVYTLTNLVVFIGLITSYLCMTIMADNAPPLPIRILPCQPTNHYNIMTMTTKIRQCAVSHYLHHLLATQTVAGMGLANVFLELAKRGTFLHTYCRQQTTFRKKGPQSFSSCDTKSAKDHSWGEYI